MSFKATIKTASALLDVKPVHSPQYFAVPKEPCRVTLLEACVWMVFCKTADLVNQYYLVTDEETLKAFKPRVAYRVAIYASKDEKGDISIQLVSLEGKSSWNISKRECLEAATEKTVLIVSDHNSKLYAHTEFPGVDITPPTYEEADELLEQSFDGFILDGLEHPALKDKLKDRLTESGVKALKTNKASNVVHDLELEIDPLEDEDEDEFELELEDDLDDA